VRATVVLPTPPLSAPTTTTVGFAMVDSSFALRWPVLAPPGSAFRQKIAAEAKSVAPVSP
jgi:hypothetical protein